MRRCGRKARPPVRREKQRVYPLEAVCRPYRHACPPVPTNFPQQVEQGQKGAKEEETGRWRRYPSDLARLVFCAAVAQKDQRGRNRGRKRRGKGKERQQRKSQKAVKIIANRIIHKNILLHVKKIRTKFEIA